jgi:hypothetical protein
MALFLRILSRLRGQHTNGPAESFEGAAGVRAGLGETQADAH